MSISTFLLTTTIESEAPVVEIVKVILPSVVGR
jgi:hypothetical protein